jgi:hypothetical protein
MRVALCIFGQPRIINNPYTFQSHEDWIIKKYKTDVFAHSWISGEETNFNYSDWTVIDELDYEDKNTDSIILEKYKPKKFKFEKPRSFTLDSVSRDKVKDLPYYSLNNENNILSHLYSLSTSISLIDEVYDWIIVSRYDNYIRYIPNLNELNSNGLYITEDYGNHFPDHMIFGGQKQITSLNCYNSIFELIDKINIFTPESFKRAAFYRLNETENRVRLEVGLARTMTLNKLQI